MASKYGIHFEEPAFLMYATCEMCDIECGEVTHTRGPDTHELTNLCVGCAEFLRQTGSVVWYVDER